MRISGKKFLLITFTLGLVSAHPEPSLPHIPQLFSRSGAAIPWDQLISRQDEKFTTDGTCGNQGAGKNNGMRCPREGKNLCCGSLGYCGDEDGHCGAGCQPEFGICKQSSASSTVSNAPATSSTASARVEKCGPLNGNATCTNNECCSASGFCGSTNAHCKSPDCLMAFGRCDASVVPQGLNTTTVPRPLLGDVPYGKGIYQCKNPGEIALTYDDGPYNFTDRMLDMLDEYDAKATFFITGVNIGKGPIDDPQYGWDKVIKRMHEGGHQLASHTWSHADLSELNELDRRNEMVKLEMALRNIVGVIPTYMRPPYSSCDSTCEQTMTDLGYHITYFNLDTDDYERVNASLIQGAKDIVDKALTNADPTKDEFLLIGHDIIEQTALNLTAFILETLKEEGFKAVTVGQCLGDDVDNWYRNDTGAIENTDPPFPVSATPESGNSSVAGTDGDVEGQSTDAGTISNGASSGNGAASETEIETGSGNPHSASKMGLCWILTVVMGVAAGIMV